VFIENEVIKFDVLQSRCSHCDGPVYFSQVIDGEGNRVNALHCWNGHYEKIDIDHTMFESPTELTPEQIEQILPFVGFMELDESKD
jgi:hypothetical protein|tara:strand:- start:280336 stop:280593 length:258 start_codon:yes stop_codon:yes gene_type:complete